MLLRVQQLHGFACAVRMPWVGLGRRGRWKKCVLLRVQQLLPKGCLPWSAHRRLSEHECPSSASSSTHSFHHPSTPPSSPTLASSALSDSSHVLASSAFLASPPSAYAADVNHMVVQV